MPKQAKTKSEFLSSICKEFRSEFKSDNNILFCNKCQIKVNAEKRFQVLQHRKTTKHLEYSENRPSNNQSQALVSTSFRVQNELETEQSLYIADLTKALVAGNQTKLNFSSSRQFCYHRYIFSIFLS